MKQVAVFGYNRLSVEVISRLDKQQYQMIVIDHIAEHIQLAEEDGFQVANIDFRVDDDLRSVGIGSSVDTLFCFFEEDSENVFLTLSASALD